MVYRARGQHHFKTRVRGKDRTRVMSTGSSDKRTAQNVEMFVRALYARRQWETLDLILSRRISLPTAYDQHIRGTLEAVVQAALSMDRDPLLASLVSQWEDRGADAVYVRMVRSLVRGDFRLSSYRRKTITDHLASLPVGVVTKRKYRVAFSMFAKWLIEQEVIDTNPARDVQLGRAPLARIAFLEPEQQKALITTLAGEQRALEALMAGSGIEWQAALRLHRRNIEPKARLVHAYGSKNVHRDRWVEVTEDWCWDIFWNHAKSLTPNAQVFTTLGDRRRVLETHKRRSKVLRLPATSLHQYRHAFAVMWIRRGCDRQWLKNQLGHAPSSTMLERIYGVYIQAAKLSEQQKSRLAATDSATSAHVKREARGRK